jgi:hypothetical protein
MNGGIDMAADNGVIGVSPGSRVTVAGPVAVTGPITRAIGRSVTGPIPRAIEPPLAALRLHRRRRDTRFGSGRLASPSASGAQYLDNFDVQLVTLAR